MVLGCLRLLLADSGRCLSTEPLNYLSFGVPRDQGLPAVQTRSSVDAPANGIRKFRRSTITAANPSGAGAMRSRVREVRHCADHAAANSSLNLAGVSIGNAVSRRSKVRRTPSARSDWR